MIIFFHIFIFIELTTLSPNVEEINNQVGITTGRLLPVSNLKVI